MPTRPRGLFGWDYLRILMDKIFGRDFFLTKISWQRAADTTVLGQGETPVNDVVEYILVYGSLASSRKIFRKSTEVLEKKSFQQYHHILKSLLIVEMPLNITVTIYNIPSG